MTDVDLLAVSLLGFPPAYGGPLRSLRMAGIAASREQLSGAAPMLAAMLGRAHKQGLEGGVLEEDIPLGHWVRADRSMPAFPWRLLLRSWVVLAVLVLVLLLLVLVLVKRV